MNKPAYWSFVEPGKLAGVSVQALLDSYGTPLYVYDLASIERQFRAYADHPRQPHIHYAVKANSNINLLRKLAQLGSGFDIVSQGELERVLIAGGKPEGIIFSGVAKTAAEIRRALQVGIGCFNVESAQELALIAEIACAEGKVAPIALRVNPDVDAKTHPYISTGMKGNKFGVTLDQAYSLYQQAAADPDLNIRGVSCHIGSQITTLSPFITALESLLVLARQLRAEGIVLEYIDMGGGLGIQMGPKDEIPTPQQYVDVLYQCLGDAPYQLHLEPGRSLVGNAGVLLTRVIGEKEQSGKRFVMVDGAMNDYIRPALYQAVPPVMNLSESESPSMLADIVGPVCESSDFFVKNIEISVKTGDILAFGGVGAYGSIMSSQYNSRLRPAEVLLEKSQAHQIRKRDTYAQLWENEQMDGQASS